jgi:hypothetical protein
VNISKNSNKIQKINSVNLKTSMNLKERDLKEESKRKKIEHRRDIITWLRTMRLNLEKSKS